MNGGEELIQKIWKIITQVWETEEIPEDWKMAIIYPIHKKGDKKDCNSYRGIYKIFTSCILSRLKETSENVIGEYKGGFRLGLPTIDQIFIVRPFLKKI
jgi:hypothetical protein